MTIIVRPSSLPTYPDCARRWAANHLRAMVTAAGYSLRQLGRQIGAAVGTATHAAAAAAFRARKDGQPIGADCEEAGMAALDAEIEVAVGWDDTTPDRNTAQHQIRRQYRVYREAVIEKVEPLVIEGQVEAVRPSGVIVSGRTDLVIAAPVVLRDLKTGRAKRANGAQYGTYSRLLRSNGTPVTALIEDYVARVAKGASQPHPEEIPYDIAASEAQSEAILRRIESDLRAFSATGEAEVFLANPNSMLCSARYCPAHGTGFCQVHRGAKP